MPGSSTTPGRVDARFHAPTRVAFRIRNGVGTRDKNLYEAQWLACVLLYRRFAAALTGVCARLEADVVSYSFIVSDLHRLLVAGLPAHCERFWTLPARIKMARKTPYRAAEQSGRDQTSFSPQQNIFNEQTFILIVFAWAEVLILLRSREDPRAKAQIAVPSLPKIRRHAHSQAARNKEFCS